MLQWTLLVIHILECLLENARKLDGIDGKEFRQIYNSLLWEAVGNNTALLYSDIASAAPEMIKNTLDKLNKDE